MSNKYIKLEVSEEARTGRDTIVFYKVLETKNIDKVEPGYVYQFYRPNLFIKNFEEGYWDGVDIHMVL
mgnify:CR=1 FL=1